MKSVSLFTLPLTEELVSGLEKLYPPKCPGLAQSERDIFFYAGQQFLVQRLRVALDYQKHQQRTRDDSNDGRIKAFTRIAGYKE